MMFRWRNVLVVDLKNINESYQELAQIIYKKTAFLHHIQSIITLVAWVLICVDDIRRVIMSKPIHFKMFVI